MQRTSDGVIFYGIERSVKLVTLQTDRELSEN